MRPPQVTTRNASAIAVFWIAAAAYAGLFTNQLDVALAFAAIALTWALVANSCRWTRFRLQVLEDLVFDTHVVMGAGARVAMRELREGNYEGCERVLSDLNVLATDYTIKVAEAAPNGHG